MFRKNNKQTVVQTGLLSAFRLMGLQAVLVVLISLAWGLYSFQAMTSCLLGGIISILPNAYFARRFFASGHSGSAQKIVRVFYIGEVLKLAVTVALVFFALKALSVLILPFLTGFIGASLGLWFAPLLLSMQRKTEAVAL